MVMMIKRLKLCFSLLFNTLSFREQYLTVDEAAKRQHDFIFMLANNNLIQIAKHMCSMLNCEISKQEAVLYRDYFQIKDPDYCWRGGNGIWSGDKEKLIRLQSFFRLKEIRDKLINDMAKIEEQ